MTNKIALALTLIIIGVIVADLLVFGWDLHIFLGRKFVDLTQYIAFWR